MKKNQITRLCLSLLFALGTMLVGANAANSEEDTLKRIQLAKYNVFTGNWDVPLKADIENVSASIKSNLPGLDYTLVDEESNGPGRETLTFRGEGDQKVVIKLKRYDAHTNLRIRVGLTGNESKSSHIFDYIYRRM